MAGRNRIPYWVKLLYLAWLVILLRSYWIYHGPQNLLWLCGAANIILLFALWRESALLMSSQACGVVLVQLLYPLVMFYPRHRVLRAVFRPRQSVNATKAIAAPAGKAPRHSRR